MSYSEREWQARVEEFGHRCVYCGNFVTGNPKNAQGFSTESTKGLAEEIRKHKLTKDHAIPTDRGGPDEIWNLYPACERCNLMKRHSTAQEFIRARPELCKFAVFNNYFLILGRKPAKITHALEYVVLREDEFCPLHPESGRTHWGTCWSCYSLRCEKKQQESVTAPPIEWRKIR